MTRARLLHHVEYLAVLVVLIAAAVWHRGELTAWFWVFLVAPDVVGFAPGLLVGAPPRKGYLPPRAVPWYNLAHTFTLPLAAWAVVLLLTQGDPWPILGWLVHIAADRTLGFGLRGDDGGQAVL